MSTESELKPFRTGTNIWSSPAARLPQTERTLASTWVNTGDPETSHFLQAESDVFVAPRSQRLRKIDRAKKKIK